MTPRLSQGANANLQGRHIQKMVAEAMSLCGLLPAGSCPLGELAVLHRSISAQPGYVGYFAEQVEACHRGLFGRPHYSHFAIQLKWWHRPVLVETMGQRDSGSKDRQLAYLCESFIDIFPLPGLIILEGAGFHEGHFDYLRRKASENPERLLRSFCSIDEFRVWLSGNPRLPGEPQQDGGRLQS